MTPTEWLLSDDTCMSSKTICAVMTGTKYADPDVPYDAGDFGRCYRLLELFPEWRARLPEVAAKHPKWGPLVSAWDELTALYRRTRGQGGRTFYDRISALVDEGRRDDGWVELGPGCWQKGDTFTSRM
jgi:hypothetical protein